LKLKTKEGKVILAFMGAFLWWIGGWDSRTYWNGSGPFWFVVYPVLLFYFFGGAVMLYLAVTAEIA